MTQTTLFDEDDPDKVPPKISKPTIWRMRDDGKLPPTISLTSQCLRWNREAVVKWIDAGCPVLRDSPGRLLS